jgi:hypothetical protein
MDNAATTDVDALYVGNMLAGEPLNWTITEAASDCSSPSDLGWVSTSATAGTTASSSSSSVTVTFDTAGLSAPAAFSGLLCIASNDPGEPLITISVALQVQYPFGGFTAPVGGGLNVVEAGSNVPVKFQLGGDRGLAILAGPVTSAPADCDTLEPTGAATAVNASALVWDGDKYQVNWKTSKSWSGTCRILIVALDDTSTYTAAFRFS